MPNLKELAKIRKSAIKKYMDENILEKFLFNNSKYYYDKFITSNLVLQAEKNLQDDTITSCSRGIFVNTDNAGISKLFLDKVASINFDFFSSEDIDLVLTKENPILRVSKFVGYNLCYYFIRLNYIKKLAADDGYDFKMTFAEKPDNWNNLFVEFEISSRLPKLGFAPQKMLIKKP